MPQGSGAADSVDAMSSCASTPQLAFLDCLHPSAFGTATTSDFVGESADPQRCLRTVLRLLTNHYAHPADNRYASFSAVSTVWQRDVCPWVYALRLVAWMGCVPDAEGARYIFRGCSDALRLQLQNRIDELQCVMAVWATSVAALSPSSTSTNVKVGEKEEEMGKHWEAARAALRRLYCDASKSQSLTREDATVALTRALQVGLLSRVSRALAARVPSSPTPSSSPTENSASCSLWLTRLPETLQTFALADEPWPTTPMEGPLLWLLQHATLCELTRECEQAAAAAAAAVGDVLRSTLPSTSSPCVSVTSSALVERYRTQARFEQHQRYIESTGPAYRRLTQEERHRGESVVIDIAGLLEQLAVVRETQGMVRTDRQEARRLLEAFKQDGDLVTLYALQERYTMELEEAKRVYEKPLVYAEYD